MVFFKTVTELTTTLVEIGFETLSEMF
jgi:hypothetical protein